MPKRTSSRKTRNNKVPKRLSNRADEVFFCLLAERYGIDPGKPLVHKELTLRWLELSPIRDFKNRELRYAIMVAVKSQDAGFFVRLGMILSSPPMEPKPVDKAKLYLAANWVSEKPWPTVGLCQVSHAAIADLLNLEFKIPPGHEQEFNRKRVQKICERLKLEQVENPMPWSAGPNPDSILGFKTWEEIQRMPPEEFELLRRS
jgi:hypothetical protein